jgi:hypothetical protein
MPEAATNFPAHDDANFAIADRMSREVAILAGRLARLLAHSPAAQEGHLAGGNAFLNAMFEAATAGQSATDLEGPATDRRPPAQTHPEIHPIDRLATALALEPREVDLIFLAAMAEEHEGYASILRSLNPQNEPFATTGLAAQLQCHNSHQRLDLRRTLEAGASITNGVLALRGEVPFFEKSLILADGLWSALCGLAVLPPSLKPIALSDNSNGLARWLESSDVVKAQAALHLDQPILLMILADTEAIASHRAAALTRAASRSWIAVDFAANQPTPTDRLVLLHSLARGDVPIFRLAAPESSAPVAIPNTRGFPATVVVCARRGTAVPVDLGRPVLTLAIDPLPASAREHLWQETLPELAEHASTLAARYIIEPSAAAEVAVDLRARHSLNGDGNDLDAVAGCVRARSNLHLSAGVKLVQPTARWDQLVLPPDRAAQLTEALHRLLHQATVLDQWKFLEGRPGARGVRVLLSGPPGTGKTLAAEVVAHSLGVDLLMVDISRVVSKWIGETEKHLAEAFDVAEKSHAVLLFDEADALFGKRTEVSDAHDRYANLETAYLLSRLERFDGLAILSTNLKQNIDPAFLRRLEFVIDFDEPSALERESLWQCHLPPTAPLAPDVNLKELANLYPIVGGLIRNASVAAGFLAAAAGTAISRNHLVGAIRREYEKSGKSFPGVPAGVLRT